MPDDLITERQGDRIISLLENILREIKEINLAVRFDLQSGIEEANKTLDSIKRDIGKLK